VFAPLVKLVVSIGSVLSVLAAILIGAALSGTFAVLRLPAPTGPYSVGTALRDAELGEGKRTEVQLWYPVENVANTKRSRYRFADTSGVPLVVRLLRSLVRSDAFLDADVAGGAHPVLLYFPSWGGTRADNTALAEDLASNGFVVVGMDDMYPSRPLDFSSEASYEGSVRWGDRKVELQASAARRVLDTLGSLNANDPEGRFTAHLDMTRIGALGFSFGGAVAGQLARDDHRVRAAADMDGWLFGDVAKHGLSKPFLILGGNDPDAAPPAVLENDKHLTPDERYAGILDWIDGKQIVAGFQENGGFLLTINGAEHFNFTDLPFLPSIRHTSLGPIDATRAARVVREYLLQFFGHFLNGAPAPLLEPAKTASTPARAARVADPDARLEIWPANGRYL
jgi:predicted dienelactone hydrolase